MSEECNCDPPCPEGISFADHYFGTHETFPREPLVRIGEEWVKPHREGDHVFVEHDGKKFQIVSNYGYFNSGVVGLRPVEPSHV
jgi:hypothetical protein